LLCFCPPFLPVLWWLLPPPSLLLSLRCVCVYPLPVFVPRAELCSLRWLSCADVRRSGIDPTVSGTTAVAALVDGYNLHVANCGDSRGIMLRGVGDGTGGLVPHAVTIDHKPSRPQERDRVASNRDARVYQESQVGGRCGWVAGVCGWQAWCSGLGGRVGLRV